MMDLWDTFVKKMIADSILGEKTFTKNPPKTVVGGYSCHWVRPRREARLEWHYGK